jgi:hypothetical protein
MDVAVCISHTKNLSFISLGQTEAARATGETHTQHIYLDLILCLHLFEVHSCSWNLLAWLSGRVAQFCTSDHSGWAVFCTHTHTVYIRRMAPLADCWEETVKTIPARFGLFFFILVVLYRRPTIDNKNSLTSGGIDLLPNHGPDTNAGGEHVQAVPLCSVKIYYMG